MIFKGNELNTIIKCDVKPGICQQCQLPKKQVKIYYTVAIIDGQEYLWHYLPQLKAPDIICDECILIKKKGE